MEALGKAILSEDVSREGLVLKPSREAGVDMCSERQAVKCMEVGKFKL